MFVVAYTNAPSTPLNLMENFVSMRPLEPDRAIRMIRAFRNQSATGTSGVYFTIEDLRAFVQHWDEIMAVQPMEPGSYAVGLYFATGEKGNTTVVLAPVLVQPDKDLVIDALQDASTSFTIPEAAPYFFFNEGSLWP